MARRNSPKAKRFKFVSSERVKDLITTAYSTFHNSRNLEVEYYTAYMLSLDAVADIPDHGTLVARQQPNIWLTKEREELSKQELMSRHTDGYSDDEGNSDEDPDEPRRSDRLREKTEVNLEAVAQAMTDFRELSVVAEAEAIDQPIATIEEDVGDMSIASIKTVPEGEVTKTEPDGVVCHICVIDIREPPNGSDANARFAWDKRHGRKTNHMCFPAMMELKRAPSRCLRGAPLLFGTTQLLAEAEHELQLYCSLQFARDGRASGVVAISGAGGWWRWVKFTRDEIPPYHQLQDYRNGQLDPAAGEQYFHKYVASYTQRFKRAKLRYMGSKESDAEWTRLRQNGLIPILEAHRTDYPRLFQPPPDLARAANEGDENQAGPSGVADQAAESAAPAKTRRGKRADSPPTAGQTEANDAADRGVSSRRMTRAAAKQAKANQTGTTAQAGRPTRQAQENQADPSGVANQAVEPLAAPTQATRRRAGGRRANSPRAAGQTEQANENQPAAGTGAQAGRQARGNKARQAQARAHAQAQAGSSDDADAGMSRAGRDRKGKGRMRG